MSLNVKYDRKYSILKYMTKMHSRADAIAASIMLLYNAPECSHLRFVVALQGAEPDRLDNYIASINEEEKDRIWNALIKGCKEDEWSDFLSIDTLFRQATPEELRNQAQTSQATAKSWRAEYKGTSHELLWEHICRYYRHYEGFTLYANIFAVVQSSEMGKSRTVYELGKTHFLIPVILRKGTSGYPPPDDEVHDFLVFTDSGASDSLDRAQGRFIRSLCSLFRNTLMALQRAQSDDASVFTKADMIHWFYSRMAPPENNMFRKEFFKTVVEDAQADGSQSTEPSGTSSDPGRRAVLDMIGAANALVDFLRSADRSSSDQVEVVVAFDEADVLSERVFSNPTVVEGVWSLFTALRDVIRALYLPQSIPDRRVDPSMRVMNERYKPVPPFTTFRYDLYGPQLLRAKDGCFILSEDQVPIQNDGLKDLQAAGDQTLTLLVITNTAFIVRFGRPLFALMYGNANSMTNGKGETPAHVEFACLSQRLCLEFDSTAYNDDEETQIAGHMRLCLKIDLDSQHIISSSGSEPLLAEAAATLMMRDGFNPAESLHRVLTGFSIHKEDQGELISMLAVVVSRDGMVRRKIQETPELNSVFLGTLSPDKERQQPAFRAVQIIDLLDELFKLPKKVKKALEADFEDTYTYFNHFIKPFTQVLCINCMPGVEFVLPTLKGPKLHSRQISVVAAQVKLDDTITLERDGEVIFDNISDGLEKETFRDAPCELPIVRMVFSLRSKPELWYKARSITINGRKVRTHDFWCGGFGPHFLPKRKENDDSWLALASALEKMGNVVDEGTQLMDLNEERKSLVPGGSESADCWSCVRRISGPGGDGESMNVDEDT
ncbi:hypothetical protein ACEPAG_1890 [Sanghuangporus baumii]